MALLTPATATPILFKFRNEEWRWLSNLAVTSEPLRIEHKLTKFRSSEAIYQAFKYLVIDPEYLSELLWNSPSGKDVKRRSAKGAWLKWKRERMTGASNRTKSKDLKDHFDAYKAKFEKEYRDVTMRFALYLKFTQDLTMKKSLLETGRRPLHEQTGREGARSHWTKGGSDMLGKMLMELRNLLRIDDEKQLQDHYAELAGQLTLLLDKII